MASATCDHCGLPVTGLRKAGEGPLYCCYGCYLVSRLIGPQDGGGLEVWNVLRLATGAFFAMDVMMISLLLYTRQVEGAAVPYFRWGSLGLAVPAMLILGYPFAVGAVREIARGVMNLDTLIAAGSFTAFAVSAVNTVRGRGDIFFDTATMLVALVTFGRIIEASAKTRAGALVRQLETLLPARAHRVEAGGVCDVMPADIRVGDRLAVRPGERIPADGCVVEGSSIVAEAAFTGESRPRACGRGDAVIAGTINGSGALVIEARQVGERLLLRRILAMVEEAQREAAPMERLAQRAARWFIPAVLLLAAGTAAAWWAMGQPAKAGLSALAVVVVACPCAMGIAAPLATALAIARAAKDGVVVRGGAVMELAGQIATVFLDKTGTLTTGQMELRRVQSLDPACGEEDVLGWLAALESLSEHAIARAVATAAKARGLPAGAVRDLQAVPGQGVRGWVTYRNETREVRAGNEAFAADGERAFRGNSNAGIPASAFGGAEGDTRARMPALLPAAEALPDGDTEVFVAWEGKVRGRAILGDIVRADAAGMVRRLTDRGIRPVLLSGDRADAAGAIAGQLGIQEVIAPCRPDDKVARIRQGAGAGVTAMIGDGINDAPALAAADVGIALGAGTDMARSAGNVILLSDRLAQVDWLIDLSRRTRRIIKQNLAWAFGYNALALAAAAAGVLHPLLAAAAMVVSSLTVLTNSLRLHRFPSMQGDRS